MAGRAKAQRCHPQISQQIVEKIAFPKIFLNKLLTKIAFSKIFLNKLLTKIAFSKIFLNKLLNKIALSKMDFQMKSQRILSIANCQQSLENFNITEIFNHCS